MNMMMIKGRDFDRFYGLFGIIKDFFFIKNKLTNDQININTYLIFVDI